MRVKYVGEYIEQIPKSVKNCIKFDIEDIKKNTSLFRLLNAKDRDILYLIFVSNKKQKAVQELLGRSQPLLCYDIKRIKERIQFIAYLRQVFDIFVDFLETKSYFFDKIIIQVLVLMFFTTSYTHTAKIIGKPQIFVRYTFEKTLKLLKEKELWDIYEIFNVIYHNKNKVKRM